MKAQYMDILVDIIGGVESGGQVYGKRDYSAYAAAYQNSPKEVTCTLGWAQNYGYSAQKLIQTIFDADKETFRQADTAGIESRMKKDWVREKWNPSAKEKKALIAIITTNVGKRVQDKLFEELLETYIKDAEEFGVTDIAAQMMWCEIQHLGGKKPTERIFDRAKKPYTPDSIFASLLLDQKDASNTNQVGDKIYQSRHECCMKWIKEYVSSEKTGGVTAADVVDIMAGWVGMSRSKGTHKPIIDIYNSYKPLARGYKVTYTDAYCATTVSAAFIKANAVKLIGGTECGVEEFIQIFKKKGIWNEDGTIVPKMGYICCYNWDDRAQPNDGYADHIGIVESVDILEKAFVVIEGNMDGGIVGRRRIPFGWGYIRGFAIPKYAEPKKEDKKSSDNDSAVSGQDRVLFVGEVAADVLNVRVWAGTEYPCLQSYPQLAKTNLVDVMDYTQTAKDGTPWYFVRILMPDKKTSVKGFVSSKWIKRV